MPQLPAGHRHGRLTIIEFRRDPREPKHPKYLVRCDCGQTKLVQADNLTRTHSCGCLRVEQLRERSTTHGMSHTPEFRAWVDMRDRCSRKSRHDFPRYGGRGITVCQQWQDSFEAFIADMGRLPSPQHEIDRIDNDRGYEPENCRWATQTEQRNNQRRSVQYTFHGVSGSLKDLARHFGLSYSMLHQRMTTLGWSLEKSMTTPRHH